MARKKKITQPANVDFAPVTLPTEVETPPPTPLPLPEPLPTPDDEELEILTFTPAPRKDLTRTIILNDDVVLDMDEEDIEPEIARLHNRNLFKQKSSKVIMQDISNYLNFNWFPELKVMKLNEFIRQEGIRDSYVLFALYEIKLRFNFKN